MRYPAESNLWKVEQLQNRTSNKISFTQSQVLARFRQFFPFTIFCDELIIEEGRVVWIENKGPWTKELISIMATDIACVNASTGPFIGHIHIKSLTGGPEILIDRLLSSDIYKIRSFVEGIAMAARNGVTYKTNDIEAKRRIFLKTGEIN